MKNIVLVALAMLALINSRVTHADTFDFWQVGSGSAGATSYLQGPSGGSGPATWQTLSFTGPAWLTWSGNGAFSMAGATGQSPHYFVGTGTGTTVVLGPFDGTDITTGKVALARGGTNADLSATGGTNFIVQQASIGAAFTVAALTALQIPNLTEGQITNLVSDLAGKEPALGNPAVNGYVLSSTTTGTRSWVAQSAGGGGTVTSFSATVPSWLAQAVTNATTTPALAITGATSATAHKFVGTSTGTTVALNSIDGTDLPATGVKINVSSGDTTADYLFAKLVAGTNITLTKNNPGANETIGITASGGGSFSNNLPFGDGSDGAAALDGTNTFGFASKSGSTYTLTRDVYVSSMSISTGVILITAGYRLYCSGTLTLTGTANINWNGNAGATGATGGAIGVAATGGVAGTAQTDAELGGGGAGSAGANGVPSGNGTSSSSAAAVTGMGGGGTVGGAGGAGLSTTAGSGGTAATLTLKQVRDARPDMIYKTSATAFSLVHVGCGSNGGGSGGGNSSGGAWSGGAGGGGGGAAGIVYIAANTISNAGSITATGGAGGSGGGGSSVGGTGTGGGGGGSGGSGGVLIVIYGALSGAGTISVGGGAGGSGGAHGGAAGSNGSAGNTGAAGNLIKYNVTNGTYSNV